MLWPFKETKATQLTLQKSDLDTVPKIAIFKRSYIPFRRPIIFGALQPLVLGGEGVEQEGIHARGDSGILPPQEFHKNTRKTYKTENERLEPKNDGPWKRNPPFFRGSFSGAMLVFRSVSTVFFGRGISFQTWGLTTWCPCSFSGCAFFSGWYASFDSHHFVPGDVAWCFFSELFERPQAFPATLSPFQGAVLIAAASIFPRKQMRGSYSPL